MNRLSCNKQEKLSAILFYSKHALKIIIQQLWIQKQKPTKISSVEAHFARKTNTFLSAICTRRKLSNLPYDKVIKNYINEEAVPHELILAMTNGNN